MVARIVRERLGKAAALAIIVPRHVRLRAMMKFWPDAAAGPVPAEAVRLDGQVFDWCVDMPDGAAPTEAAAALLALASGTAGGGLSATVPETQDTDEDQRPIGPPLSLWRANDGWLLVHTATRDAWRNFCSTFLNRSAYRDVPPEQAWRDADINRLATTVLDTHKVDDAVGTCLTYQVPAAAVPGWHDRERGAEGRALAERLAWAALASFDDRHFSATGNGVFNG